MRAASIATRRTNKVRCYSFQPILCNRKRRTRMKLDAVKRSREEMRAHLAAALRGLYDGAAAVSPIEGGAEAARQRLENFDARRYDSRNHVTRGQVSRLSPYIRHGVVTLREARDFVFRKFGRAGKAVYTFVFELAWRQYWHEIYKVVGDGVHADREAYKFAPPNYAGELPADIENAATGLVCMDESLRELYETGSMHNHARMWVAAYVIHHRHIHWSVGERLFFKHLLDGDAPPNALSWQWVASTFATKPYYFNRQNIEKYTDGAWCARCAAPCPFAKSYEHLAADLFPDRTF
jgi:deoxyribodipyrimidine photo-lyase